MPKVDYVHIDIDAIEDEESKAFAHQANENARLIAETHVMVSAIFQVFEQLKPLMSSMPKLPGLPGGGMPGMPPVLFPNKR